MKIGVLQINPVVGDLEGNGARILDAVGQAVAPGGKNLPDLCVATELCLLGYPPRDLLLFEAVAEKSEQALDGLARDLVRRFPDGPPVLVGSVARNRAPGGRALHNAAWLLDKGRVGGPFCKTLLPTYDVFDEDRYFEPGDTDNMVEIHGKRVAVTICEDLWNDPETWERPRYHTDRVDKLLAADPDLIVNLSASPFTLGKQRFREELLARTAQKAGQGKGAPLVYVNQVGGNDELVFDGRSSLFGPDGALLARLPGFEQGVAVWDTDQGGQGVAEDDFGAESEAWRALVLGTRDYAAKCGFTTVLLGLSGGIDSAVTATVAAHALGPDNVTGVLMPSPYSSRGSVEDSKDLAKRLGIKTLTLPIGEAMAVYDRTLSKSFQGLCADVTEENIQSRIRGNLLMALSNKHKALLLTTGNKSELAVGYCTIYGDMSGGLAVISDVPKTLVFALARWINAHLSDDGADVIPEAILTKPPSAELRPGQLDADSLPDYAVLDEILALHVEGRCSGDEIKGQGYDPKVVDRVLNLVRGAEFKRRQAAPGLKITSQAFGMGWRMPIACRRPL